MAETLDEFHKAMDDNPNAVYIVQTFLGFERQGMAIFSKLRKAEQWCQTRPEKESCVICPYVIDEPDFGNTPKGQLA